MFAALAFGGSDCRFEFGEGTHSVAHGGAVLPDTLRWLWAETGVRGLATAFSSHH